MTARRKELRNAVTKRSVVTLCATLRKRGWDWSTPKEKLTVMKTFVEGPYGRHSRANLVPRMAKSGVEVLFLRGSHISNEGIK